VRTCEVLGLLVPGALTLAAGGLTVIATTAVWATSAFALIPGLLIFSVSRPLIFTPASAGALGALPTAQRGVAAGLVTETRQLGTVLGAALLAGFLSATTHVNRRGLSSSVSGGFTAAILSAAVLVGVTALLVWRYMPREPQPGSQTHTDTHA
jgi:hypothetical protein